jgi:hypothetical protein
LTKSCIHLCTGAPSATDEEDADLEKEFDDLEADIEAESLSDIERLLDKRGSASQMILV